MIYPVQISGFEGRDIRVENNSLSGRNTLLIDGQPAPAGLKRGQFLLRSADGREVVASFKSAFPDTTPILIVDGQPIHLVEKLKPYEMVWACFPLVLIFVGGLIGGILGGLGSALNLQIFRAKIPLVARYALAALITVVCFTAWVVIATPIQSAIRR